MALDTKILRILNSHEYHKSDDYSAPKYKDFHLVNGLFYYLDGRQLVFKEDVTATLQSIFDDDTLRILGRDRFYKSRVCQKYIGISLKDVANFLKTQEVYQLHLPAPKHTTVQPIIVSAPGSRYQMDLVDFSQDDTVNFHNRPYKWLFTCIDLYSKYAWAIPIRSKEHTEIKQCLDTVLERKKPKIIQSDNGKEFTLGIDEYITSLGIRPVHSEPYKPQTQGAIEKFNGILKKLIASFCTLHATDKWSIAVQPCLYSYNSTWHSTIKDIPEHVFAEGASEKVMEATMASKKKLLSSYKAHFRDDISVGDTVRVSLSTDKDIRKDARRKSYLTNWSKELYTVVAITEPLKTTTAKQYSVIQQDDKTAKVISHFYRTELQKLPTVLVKMEDAAGPADEAPGKRVVHSMRTASHLYEHADKLEKEGTAAIKSKEKRPIQRPIRYLKEID